MCCEASENVLSLMHPGNTRFTEIYCGYTIYMTVTESFCFTGCTLHSIYATLNILLDKKSLQEMW